MLRFDARLVVPFATPTQTHGVSQDSIIHAFSETIQVSNDLI